MKNEGNFSASICEIVRWLGEKAEGLGVNVFTGFPADALLVEGQSVVGVRTTPAGLDREGNPGGGYTPPTDLTARVVALADGCREPALRRRGASGRAIGVREPPDLLARA